MPLPLLNGDPNQDQSLPTGNDATGLPLRRVYIGPDPSLPDVGDAPVGDGGQFSAGNPTLNSVLDKLLGTNGQDRYQLWPEKLIRDALAAPHDAMNTTVPVTSQDLIKPALDVSAMAGTGGLAGAGEGAGAATLGAGPFLRPALKYEGKIYKAPMGGQHMDAIPADLQPEFTRQAMNGEDISNFNFGFMNHKGQFLDREKAMDYAVKEGLIDPRDAKYGALTSTLMADSGKEASAIDAISKQPFYSAAEKAVNDIPQAKMTGDQWLGTLANKPGVKSEELQYTGLNDFLKSKGGSPVTKEEVQSHLQNNKVELGEVDKGGNVKSADYEIVKHPTGEGFALQDKQGNYKLAPEGYRNEGQPLRWETEELAKGGMGVYEKTYPTKYHSYQLPGGENYREKLLTLPNKGDTLNARRMEIEKLGRDATPEQRTEWADIMNKLKPDNRDIEGIDRFKGFPEYKSSHWDEPNIIAHTRMNDRMIDGKKSLHIEEIQSDWHQQGRDKGYDTGKQYFVRNRVDDVLEKFNSEKEANSYIANKPDEKLSISTMKPVGGVPDAPFKKTWHELALKRMIREAAEKGYDRLSWTPGEAQAARYDLSKSVDKIAVPMVNENGTRSVRIDSKTDTPFKLMVDKEGKVTGAAGSSDQFSGKPLSEVVGKEMADKIMKLEKPNEFSGEGLKIGGEGMKGFYDKIIPKALEKISGEKVKHGGVSDGYQAVDKTGEVVAGFKDKVSADKWVKQMGSKYEVKAKDNPVHYIDMTPALKAKALKGFPLFSDSSKPATAIEATSKAKPLSKYEQILEAQRATEGYTAAMRDPETGKIYTGSSHQAAIDKAPKYDPKADETTNGTWGRLSSEWDKSTDNSGFIDRRTGKFISRSEAEKKYKILTMEDLKDLRKSKTAQFR